MSSEGLELINFLLEVAGIPLALGLILYYFRKPLKNFFMGENKKKSHKKINEPKVIIKIT